MNSYSGIGSRNITTKEAKRISLVSDYMFSLGYVLTTDYGRNIKQNKVIEVLC